LIGEDDATYKTTGVSAKPDDRHGFEGIALEPQRMRTFEIDYTIKQKK